jgi:hypothetical protein
MAPKWDCDRPPLNDVPNFFVIHCELRWLPAN